jgi:photosystem II stability/assembly factor-like uncharacterized protein
MHPMFSSVLRAFVALAIVAAAFTGAPAATSRGQAPAQPAAGEQQAPAGNLNDPASLLSWRSIGPPRGGRSIAVSGVRGRPKEAYFGAVGGGLWKTTDAGENWAPVTDGQIGSSSVGAVAVAEANPDLVYIGMGESCIRGNIMPGDGVYKSTDAGRSWTHVGFRASDAIAKIRIHPTRPDDVFVASFGKYGVPSDERGVFKTTDGGRTWRRTLFRDDKTGAVDIAIDRRNPDVVYAALWEAYRVEYQMSSGGPGSGLFKSTDGGETWIELTRRPGLPSGVVGKIGIAVSGADSNRLYALLENASGGLFVSDDAGGTWKLVNANRNFRQRAFYYTHVAADPANRDTVYLLNVSAYRSADGGKALTAIGAGTHGDHHDLWIDPDDSKHLVLGNDGGGAVSLAAGQNWSPQDFPTAQYYHVVTTKHVPYHVCGAQQDGSTVCLPSDTNLDGRGGGGGRGAQPVGPYGAGGSEPGYIAPDPKDPDVLFAGGNNGTFMTRLNRRTGELREVNPYPRMFSGEPSSALVERWQWTYPIVFSPVDPNALYTSSQHVWRTMNGGQSWEKISGDLTRHDPKTMGESGGPITRDMNSPEVYGTVFALGPGKTNVNILWAGSDDGLVHVTRDAGKTWINVTPREMPEFGRVSQIDASMFDPGGAYIAVKKPLLNDFAPYLFRTHDYGRTWTRIVNGIAPTDYTHVVREDPARKGLLYAGTQNGVYVSYNDGDSWKSLSLNLPRTQISDLVVEANSLAIATHGRSFYVLDDLNVVRQAPEASTSTAPVLFKPADATRGGPAATVAYLLRAPAKSLTIDILDGAGRVVQSIPGRAATPPGRGGGGRGGDPPAAADGREGEQQGGGRGGAAPSASMAPGLNRVAWNLTYQGPTTFPGMVLWGATTAGPAALPGSYEVRLTVDGQSMTQPLRIRKHPQRSVSDSDLREQFDLAMRIRDKVSEANNAVIQLRSLKQQIGERLSKSTDAGLKSSADRLTAGLSAIEEAIYQVRNQSNQDPLNFPIKINNRIASLLRVVNTGDGKPIGNAAPIFADLSTELKTQTDRLQEVLLGDVRSFNEQLQRLQLAPLELTAPQAPAGGR